MAIVKPFSCYRPNGAAASQVAALPYAPWRFDAGA